jgi:hypothetical protein
MFWRFESLVVADDWLHAFLSEAGAPGLLGRTRLRALYGEKWREIAIGLRNDTRAIEIVQARCRSAVPFLTAAKARTVAAVIAFLACLPTFDVGPPRTFPARVAVPFCRTLEAAGLLEAVSAVRDDGIRWLCRAVMPRFLAVAPDTAVRFIGSETLANALRLYGEACARICGLFALPTKRAVPAGRPRPPRRSAPFLQLSEATRQRRLRAADGERFHFSACIEDAAFQLQREFLPAVRTTAGAFLKGAIARLPESEDFPEMVAEAEAMFGGRAVHFFGLLYAHTRLAAAAAQLQGAAEWRVLAEVADACRGAPWARYRAAVAERGIARTVRIDVDYYSDDLIVTPMSHTSV